VAKANDRLRDALLRNGLNLEHVSNATGVDQKTVERWITTGRTPYPRHRHTIASMVRETENYLWPDAVAPERKSEIAESEVVRVYPHRNSVPAELWDRLLSDAAEHIDILVLAGLFLVERPTFAKEITRKAADGAKVRLLFGDPAGREVAKRSEEEQLGKGTVAARIRNALAFVRPLSTVADVQIRFHKTTLYNSVFRFDDEMVVNTHVYGFPGAHAPALHLRRLSSGDLFETYAESFETVWAAGKPATF
jgi:lambda repressor-like predicted transcriptional regulator